MEQTIILKPMDIDSLLGGQLLRVNSDNGGQVFVRIERRRVLQELVPTNGHKPKQFIKDRIADLLRKQPLNSMQIINKLTDVNKRVVWSTLGKMQKEKMVLGVGKLRKRVYSLTNSKR